MVWLVLRSGSGDGSAGRDVWEGRKVVRLVSGAGPGDARPWQGVCFGSGSGSRVRAVGIDAWEGREVVWLFLGSGPGVGSAGRDV